MDLIDRYVYEVGRQLPRKNRADIQVELKSTLVDTLEDRVAGEPSQEDEIELLKEFGPPQKVAASYWPQGQYLIGPNLFPLFRMVVAITLIVFVIVQLVLLGIAVVFDQEVLTLLSVLDIFSEMIGSVFTAFGIIVIVFAILQRFDVKPGADDEEWDPRELPQFEQIDTVNRGGTVFEITMSLVIIAILLFLPDKIGVVLSPGMEVLLNPVIVSYIPLIILSILVGIAVDVVLLWRGRWETATRLAKIATNLFSIYVLYVLITGHNTWLAEQGVGGFLSFLDTLSEGLLEQEAVLVIGMQAFRLAFIVAMIVISVDTVKIVYQLVKHQITPPVKIALPVNKEK
ncbi:MAG: hypothetical protein WA997_02020 [Anaerolineales bacterium]